MRIELRDAESSPPRRPVEAAWNGVRFTVLGPLEVRTDGVDHAPTTPKLLQLLAMLLCRPGRLVPVDSLIHELWGNDPPRTVRKTLHTYMHHLRRCFEQQELEADAEGVLVTKSPGYLFRIDPDQVDVSAFQRLRQEGQALLDRREYASAGHAFGAALDLWSGPPLANVPCGPVLSAYALNLQEQRRSTLELRIEAEINAGMHRELIGELRSLAAADPLDECLHGQLIRVLGLSGRRSDAMAAYWNLRKNLVCELGMEPSGELRLLYQSLLSEGD